VGEPTAALSRPDWALRTAESFFFLVTKKIWEELFSSSSHSSKKSSRKKNRGKNKFLFFDRLKRTGSYEV
jgi:hypothetical protein